MEGFNESGQPAFQGDEEPAAEPEAEAETPAPPKERDYVILREWDGGTLTPVGVSHAINGDKAIELFVEGLTEEGEYVLRPVTARTLGGDPYVVKIATPTEPQATICR